MSDLQSLRESVQEIKDKLDVVISALMGDPKTPTIPGIIVRLDRLEQSNKFKNRILWTLGIALAAAAFKSYFM